MGAQIIDSAGTLYQITKAQRIGWGTLLWGYHPMYNKRLIRIELVIGGSSVISLEQAKALLVQHASKGKSKWTTRIFGSREKLAKLIADAHSWDALFKSLLFDTDT